MWTLWYSAFSPSGKSARMRSTLRLVGCTKYTPTSGSGSRILCRSSTTDTLQSRISLILAALERTLRMRVGGHVGVHSGAWP